MPGDDFDELPPDPLLDGSDGDEAPRLLGTEAQNNRRWLGIAAGVGVGSAAVAAAMMFWGRKERLESEPQSAAVKARKPVAVSHASDASAD
jgi:hypothetical protein